MLILGTGGAAMATITAHNPQPWFSTSG